MGRGSIRMGVRGGGVLLSNNTPSRCHTCTINFTLLLLSFYRLYFSLTTQETSMPFYNVTTLTTRIGKSIIIICNTPGYRPISSLHSNCIVNEQRCQIPNIKMCNSTIHTYLKSVQFHKAMLWYTVPNCAVERLILILSKATKATGEQIIICKSFKDRFYMFYNIIWQTISTNMGGSLIYYIPLVSTSTITSRWTMCPMIIVILI